MQIVKRKHPGTKDDLHLVPDKLSVIVYVDGLRGILECSFVFGALEFIGILVYIFQRYALHIASVVPYFVFL